ncbi:MAG: hypothetical protein KF756_06140 [Acidobacteria bacterium]|nr:hypothetical protein [Acidobacteriota bacterium]
MNYVGYKRVSKKRPCCICGKPDWCSFTQNESISFCARSTTSADRISDQGWGIYYHFIRKNLTPVNPKKRATGKYPLQIQSSDQELRDRVYRKLIELSPAASNSEIVYGKGGLVERGISDLPRYGSLPKNAADREMLRDSLIKELEMEPADLIGVPGFWKDSGGRIRLWSGYDINDDLMLIPFVGIDGKIQACQIRFMKHVPNKSGHYVWLSSANKPRGCGPGSPLHHVNPGAVSNKSVLVTEGALKAATAQTFLKDKYVVGNSGVASSHREIVETARHKNLEIAFDVDSFTNPHVARAMAGLIRLRYEDQESLGYYDDVMIIAWDCSFKGIDEALLAGNQIKSISVDEWLHRLSPRCFAENQNQLSMLQKQKSGRQCYEVSKCSTTP